MYFKKISNKITVSRAVMNNLVVKTVRLYTTSPSVPVFDGFPVFHISDGSVEVLQSEYDYVWTMEPYSDSSDYMYFVEATFEYNMNDETFAIPIELFSKPQRYIDRHMTIKLDKQPIRNDRYLESARQDLKVTVDYEGYYSTPTISALGGYFQNDGKVEYVDLDVVGNIVKVRYYKAPDFIVVSAWIGSVCVSAQRFDVVDKSGNVKFVGKFDDIAELFSSLNDDGNGISVAIYTGKENTDNFTEKKLTSGCSVYCNGNGYTVIDTVDSVTAGIVLDVVASVTKEELQEPVLGAISWFKQIVADTITTNELIAREVNVSGDDNNGNHFIFKASSTENKFYITNNGQQVFSVNPFTGDVFLGRANTAQTDIVSGFMYSKSKKCIRSKDDNFVVNEDGTADLKGKVRATYFQIGETSLEFRQSSGDSHGMVHLGSFDENITKDDHNSLYECSVVIGDIVDRTISFSYMPYVTASTVSQTTIRIGQGSFNSAIGTVSYTYGYKQNYNSNFEPYIDFSGTPSSTALQYNWISKRWAKADK